MAVLSIPGTSCSEWQLLCWIEAHPGLAAWLQFIGTVAALGLTYASLQATVTIAKAQLDYQNRVARNETLSLLAAAIKTAERLTETMKSLCSSLADEDFRQAWVTGRGPHVARLKRRRGRADQFPVARLDSDELGAWQLVIESYDLFLDAVSKPKPHMDTVRGTCETAGRGLDALKDRLTDIAADASALAGRSSILRRRRARIEVSALGNSATGGNRPNADLRP